MTADAPFRLRTRCKVLGVREHLRTISGRKDPVTEHTVLSQVSLGWFIHLDLDPGGIAFCVGPERPPVAVGDTFEVTLEKASG